MRTTACIAAIVLLLAAVARADDTTFAEAELERYLKPLDPDGKLKVEIRLDRAVDSDQAYALASDAGVVRVTATDRYMALVGVYDLLHRLGYRFLAANLSHYNGSAEIAPKSLPNGFKLEAPIKSSPHLKYRKLYVEEGHSHDIDSLKAIVEWMPKVGYNVLVIPSDYQGSGRVKWDNWRGALTPELQKRGIVIEVGGHGYQNFLSADMEAGKLFDRHPDWFGLDETGERRREHEWVFCTSNADAVAYLTANFLDYVQARPEIQIFDFWPPDGAKWCTCGPCNLLGQPPDRQAILLRQVQEKLKPARPGLRLEIIAYSSYLNPPETQAIDKDVLVDFCPIAQHFDAQIDNLDNKNKVYADALRAWRKRFAGEISIYSYYRKYAWDSLPVIIPHYMQRDLKWYATLPVQGVSTYAEPGDWFTYELNHYTLARLSWNSDADVDAIVKEFCDARYADASPAAQAAFATLENVVRNYCSVPHVPLKSAGAIDEARAAMLTTVNELGAARKRATDPAIARNLNRLQLICTYALLDLEAQHLRATNSDPALVKAKAVQIHQLITAHADEGIFLLRNGRLSLKRHLSRLGVAPGE